MHETVLCLHFIGYVVVSALTPPMRETVLCLHFIGYVVVSALTPPMRETVKEPKVRSENDASHGGEKECRMVDARINKSPREIVYALKQNIKLPAALR
ncbi:hypothetical protein AVEN_177638-1 [Araneus ventricosus]|uniref:Uncharacterized protein n=1 Tax=Araneus ventricosus TaxID=182803 RepID=A0A4Y2KJ66_ARAVE|nr:hypothetical protein AVEN_177638-1 [Araneus ventricosus]